jgi:hypothetical protein
LSAVNLHHTAISALFEKRLEDPYSEGGYLRRDYYEMPEDEKKQHSKEAKLSAPIHGQPSLVGYIFNQVGLGNTTLEPETLPYVKSPEGKLVRQHVEQEGGRVEVIGSNRHSRGGRNELMLIGRYLIEWDNGTQVFGQDYGPDAGPLIVHEFETPEAATQQLDALVGAYNALVIARQAMSLPALSTT